MALVDRVRAIGAQPVLLTMTPIDEVAAARDRTGYAVYARYNAVITACAAKKRVPLVIVSDGAPSDSVEADGVHLTAVGQAWAAARVYEQLCERGVWTAVRSSTR